MGLRRSVSVCASTRKPPWGILTYLRNNGAVVDGLVPTDAPFSVWLALRSLIFALGILILHSFRPNIQRSRLPDEASR